MTGSLGMRAGWWRAALALASVGLAGGCGETSLAAEGEVCVRSSQCMPGLACVAAMCTTDLSGLEGGVVPGQDAGGMMMVDAGPPMDAGPQPDAGPPPPPMDGGPPPADSGPPPPDSGPPPPPDSGPADSGVTPPIDAG